MGITPGKWVVITACLFTSGLAHAQLGLRSQSQSKPVAVLNGQPISEAEVVEQAGTLLENLETKRRDFESVYDRDRKAILETTLNRMIAVRLLAAEAQKRNVTVEQLLQIEVDKPVQVTDEMVSKFWDVNKSRIGGNFEENAIVIREYLVDQEGERAYDAFISRLRKDYSVESYLEPIRVAIAADGHPARGPASAPVTIVEFSDFECPYCGSLHEMLQEVEKNYMDKVRIIYRQFPDTSINVNAEKAAEASLCANDQNRFWQFHDAMFADQIQLSVDALKQKATILSLDMAAFSVCLDSNKYAPAVRQDITDGWRAGVRMAPSLFINGRLLGGERPYRQIQEVIDDELRRASR